MMPSPFSALRRRARARLYLAGASLSLMFAGCEIVPEPTPDPTRYFVLAAPAAEADRPATEGGLRVGLRVIELPGYLRNSRSLVETRGANEIVYRDYDRWAEPLDAGLTRVMREALLRADGIAGVAVPPLTGDPRDFEIAVRILQCSGGRRWDGGQYVAFDLVYTIHQSGAAGAVIRQGRYTAPEREWDGDAARLAALLGEAAAEAASAIAAELPR